MAQIFGKFRGVVIDNVDPTAIGRVQVTGPSIDVFFPAFAMPCSAVAGPGGGTVQLLQGKKAQGAAHQHRHAMGAAAAFDLSLKAAQGQRVGGQA